MKFNQKGSKPKKTVRFQKRDIVLGKQLHRLGKVGGVVDARFGSRDRSKSEAEKSLQRQIVEKLRQIENIDFDEDIDDPLRKAAFGESAGEGGDRFRLDEDADIGIPSDIVDEEFFGSGLKSKGFKDTLAEKIAVSKLHKLKRVEENEEQRTRIKQADVGWSQKIRFMLSELSSLKPKNLRNGKNSVKNRTSVSLLLGQLTDDKRIPPADTAPSNQTEERQLSKLRSLVENSMESSSETVVDSDHAKVPTDDAVPRRSLADLLRVLLQMPEHEAAVMAYIAQQLNQATFPHLNHVIHHLLLAQVLLDRLCSNAAKMNEGFSTNTPEKTGLFIPELPIMLTKVWRLAVGLKKIPKDATSTESLLVISQLDIKNRLCEPMLLDPSLANPCSIIAVEDSVAVRLSCLNRLTSLSIQTFRLCSSLLPACVCAHVFDEMHQTLRILDTSAYPQQMRTALSALVSSLDQCRLAPTPKRLLSTMRLKILTAEQTKDTTRVMKKFGLLPQLEPKFDDRLDARHPVKTGTKCLLRRKLAREKRGAMREIRRDGQFLAAHQLKKTKASDESRKQKTQAILNSLRSIED